MQVNSAPNLNLFNINDNKKSAETALGQISSGKNNQLDDATLALIANAIGNDMSSLIQGVKNANDATAMLQIADGVLSGLSKGADELNVLAIKANGPLINESQKSIITNEANRLAESLQMSVDNASFNGSPLFGRSLEFSLGQSSVSTSLPAFDISSFDTSSREGIADFMKSIQAAQMEVGSTTNQLDSSTKSILTTISNLSSAKSQIADADIVEQFMNFNKESLQLQSSLMAQANSSNLSAARVSMLLG
ncbi:hypothetical protein JHD50_01005 [Sulfurimonas sp. MAG313]|nr:flagellin [Sulfurimonas sp. MAG313]MDF1879889.1 hypothetical protein [Sulfurimonas sp. MAG313]